MTDKVLINVRERPLSTDIMLMQAIEQRAVADVLKYMLGSEHSRFTDALGAAPNTNFPESLVGGLIPTGIFGNSAVSISQGVVLQNSILISPTPTAADSSYRVAFTREAVSVTTPVPGGVGAWYTLRAQMVEVTTVAENRDVMNPVSAKFEPANVPKLKEWKITFSWQVGTPTNLPAPEEEYVPIAYVFLQASGAITILLDARPTLAQRGLGQYRQNWGSIPRSVISTLTSPTTVSEQIRISVSDAVSNQDQAASRGGGIKMRWMNGLTTDQTLTPTGPNVISPGTAIVGGIWYYLYLCPYFDTAPSAPLQVDAAGILVLSAVHPSQNYNGSILALPAPWSNYSVPAGVAPCVGVLLRVGNPLDAGNNDGWCMMRGKDGVYAFFQSSNTDSVPMLARVTGTPATVKSVNIDNQRIPYNTLSMKLRVVFSISAAAQNVAIVAVFPIGQTNASAHQRRTVMMPDNFAAATMEVDIDVPYDPAGLTVEVSSSGSQTISAVAVHIVELTTR